MFLTTWRDDFHGTPEGLTRLHHYTGAEVPPKKTARSWALQCPDFVSAEQESEVKKDEISWTRYGEYYRGESRSPQQWLDIRLEKREDPNQKVVEARRLEMGLDKESFLAACILRWTKKRSVPWTPSDLPDEIGWETIAGGVYIKRKKARLLYLERH